jgi:hypothetical protein
MIAPLLSSLPVKKRSTPFSLVGRRVRDEGL